MPLLAFTFIACFLIVPLGFSVNSRTFVLFLVCTRFSFASFHFSSFLVSFNHGPHQHPHHRGRRGPPTPTKGGQKKRPTTTPTPKGEEAATHTHTTGAGGDAKHANHGMVTIPWFDGACQPPGQIMREGEGCADRQSSLFIYIYIYTYIYIYVRSSIRPYVSSR